MNSVQCAVYYTHFFLKTVKTGRGCANSTCFVSMQVVLILFDISTKHYVRMGTILPVHNKCPQWVLLNS